VYEVSTKRGDRTVTFRTAAGLLRWGLDNRVFRRDTGGSPYPKRFDDIYLGRDGHPGMDYHLIDVFTDWKITGEHLSAMRRALARYGEIVHYLREVEPEWRPDTSVSPDGEIHWMDNSVERIEINKYGNKRTVRLAAPHGDVC
jgi:hypothetical protein